MKKIRKTHNGKDGGTLVGKAHYDKDGNALGGIKTIITDDNRPVEVEGGEVIINKHASKKHWRELSRINQSAGNGVPITEPHFKKGGNTEKSKFKSKVEERKKKVEKVMHEFKEGKLKSHGKKITKHKQAIAIALSEALRLKDGGELANEEEKRKLKLEILKLTNKSFRMMPHSPVQNRLLKEIDVLRERLEKIGGTFNNGGAIDGEINTNSNMRSLGDWLLNSQDGRKLLRKSKNLKEFEHNLKNELPINSPKGKVNKIDSNFDYEHLWKNTKYFFRDGGTIDDEIITEIDRDWRVGVKVLKIKQSKNGKHSALFYYYEEDPKREKWEKISYSQYKDLLP